MKQCIFFQMDEKLTIECHPWLRLSTAGGSYLVFLKIQVAICEILFLWVRKGNVCLEDFWYFKSAQLPCVHFSLWFMIHSPYIKCKLGPWQNDHWNVVHRAPKAENDCDHSQTWYGRDQAPARKATGAAKVGSTFE